MRRDNNAHRAIHARQLFDGDHIFHIAHAGAGVLGGKNCSQQSELAQLFDRSQRKLASLVPLHDVGQDFALGELTNGFLQLLLLVTQLKIQDSSTPRSRFRLEHSGRRRKSYLGQGKSESARDRVITGDYDA